LRRNFASLSLSRRQARDGSTKIKLDGFRMSARIDRGRVQLLTRTELDWEPEISRDHRGAR